jgi:hypothetical protein
MSNLFDYLTWRGDLTFNRDPFNEVDNLIFACLSYIDFQGIVPADRSDQTVTLAQAARQLKAADRTMPKGLFFEGYVELLDAAAASDRFKDTYVSYHVNAVDHEEPNQFSATVFSYDKNRHYIAFRGTDDNLAGWKEDFLMGFKESVRAQEQAARYVASVAPQLRGGIILGGHSKGGNLAVYAASRLPERLCRRIAAVYNNDGPGFLPSLIHSEGYKRIQGRIVTILPQSSVVGMLLEHGDDYKIIGSTERSILSHNPLTWQVSGTSFVHKTELSKQSRQFSEALHTWLSALNMEQREQFVEALFDILTASGARTLSDLSKERLAAIDAMIKKLRQMDKKTRGFLKDTILMFFSIRQRMLRDSLGESLEALKGRKDQAALLPPALSKNTQEF